MIGLTFQYSNSSIEELSRPTGWLIASANRTELVDELETPLVLPEASVCGTLYW